MNAIRTSRVLIAGCGDVGSALAERLVAAGCTVWGLRRSVEGLPPGVRGLRGDLTDPASFPPLPESLDAVVYAAAPDRRDERSYEAVYVRGLQLVLTRLAEAGQQPERVIFTSSTGVYGQSDGEEVDENSPTEPTSFTGARLLEAEAVLRAAPWRGIALRLGGIYGPGRGRLLRAALEGEPCRRVPPVFTNRIHREDCAGILEHLLALEDPAPVYLGVDGDPAPRWEVVTWIRARMGLPPPPEAASSGDGGSASPRGSGKRCSNRRILDSGYRLRYPSFRKGYGDLIDVGAAPSPPPGVL